MNTRHQTYSQAEVDAWNLAHPVGTACRYEDGPGKWVPTITRSEAWLLGHGVPVVKIEGKSGGYGIDCLSFPDLAEHYRTILQTIEGVIGTPSGTETDLNTLPERVAKAVVRVPDEALTPDPELLATVPTQVREAARLVEYWMKSQGHTRWALYGLQSRGIHSQDFHPDYR